MLLVPIVGHAVGRVRGLPAAVLQRRARLLAVRPLVREAVLVGPARLPVLNDRLGARFESIDRIGYLLASETITKEPEINRPRSDRPMLAMARRSAIADLLRDSGAITVTEVESRFGVSPMTARRDLPSSSARASPAAPTAAPCCRRSPRRRTRSRSASRSPPRPRPAWPTPRWRCSRRARRLPGLLQHRLLRRAQDRRARARRDRDHQQPAGDGGGRLARDAERQPGRRSAARCARSRARSSARTRSTPCSATSPTACSCRSRASRATACSPTPTSSRRRSSAR